MPSPARDVDAYNAQVNDFWVCVSEGGKLALDMYIHERRCNTEDEEPDDGGLYERRVAWFNHLAAFFKDDGFVHTMST